MFGDQLQAELDSRYFFDAPASDVALNYNVYAEKEGFFLPGYTVGPWNIDWGDSFNDFASLMGVQVENGSGATDANGKFSIKVPVKQFEVTTNYNLEVTTMDESGYPVSTVASATVHPSDFYIGVRSQQWIGHADEEMTFELKLVDWQKNPAGSHAMPGHLLARCNGSKTRLTAGASRSIRRYLHRSPACRSLQMHRVWRMCSLRRQRPGTYQLEVAGEGALTQYLIWVGGEGQTAWPQLDQNRILPVADQEEYQPGDTANVFIPNPFEGQVQGAGHGRNVASSCSRS